MACTSLVALPRACGASGVVAGTEKLYIISYNDLTPTGSSGNVYTTTTVSGSTLISWILRSKFTSISAQSLPLQESCWS